MSIPQRVVLIVGLTTFVGMIAFPPWILVYDFPQGAVSRISSARKMERFAGYHLLFADHSPQDQTALARMFGVQTYYAYPQFFTMRLDTERLAVQIGGALISVLLLYLASGSLSKAQNL